MSSANDELDEAFGPDAATEAPVSGDEIDQAFTEEEPKRPDASPPLSVGGYPTLAGFKGAADVVRSMARATVNKPAASLAGASNVAINALLGRTDPAADYRAGQGWARESINRGEGIVEPEGTHTPEGAKLAENIGQVTHTIGQGLRYTGVPQALDWIKGKIGPEASDFAGSVLEVASFGIPKLFGLGKEKIPVAGEMGGRSVGAAETSLEERISRASPELQEEFKRYKPEEINEEVADRQLKADSLPVKMKLTEGQATGDPDIITEEMNTRGATGLSQDLNLQGQQLKANIQAIRDEVGPDVFSTNEVEHGDRLIEAYKAKDAPIVKDIGAKYEALEAANGGQFPVDAPQLYTNVAAKLHAKLLFEHAPKPLMASLERLAKTNDMTFEQFEAMRTNAGRTMASAVDGNERAAAGFIRQALDELPLKPGTEHLKPLADTARSAARARFQALEADPAYKAAVDGSVPPDRFVEKFITGKGATRDNVAKMRENLIDDDAALQTMSVSTVDALRDAAGIDRAGNGKFGQARYNKRLEGLEPKLQSLLPPDAAEHVRSLGETARYIKEQPEGASVNNSGTLSGALAKFGGDVAQGALNVKTGGLAGPIIDVVKGKLNAKSLADKRANATKPFAGIAHKKPSATKPKP